MRAAVIHRYGEPDELSVEDMPEPKLGPRDVLVDVYATSVNPVDWKIRSGAQRVVIRRTFPMILGLDVSGVVVDKGAEVSELDVGDEVFSSPTHKRQGTYAQRVAIDASEVARKPKNLTHGQAAAIPLVGLTVWEVLIRKGALARDQRVFIAAGSGGVGTIAIQLAKHLGAHVASTCSTRNVKLLRELGADEVIDYTKERFDERLRDYDLAVDAMGGDETGRCLRILKRGGRLVSINADLEKQVDRWGLLLGTAISGIGIAGITVRSRLLYDVRAAHAIRRSDGRALTQLARIIEDGGVTPVVDRTFRLEQIVEAHRYSESGRARGKIVVMVR